MNKDKWSYEEIIQRNIGVLDKQEQEIIKNTRVSVVGNNNFLTSVLLAKVGFLNIKVIDEAKIAKEISREVNLHNPKAKVTECNIDNNISIHDAIRILQNSKVCIIETKNVYLRCCFARAAELLKIPAVIAIIFGTKMAVLRFSDYQKCGYEKHTMQPTYEKRLDFVHRKSLEEYHEKLKTQILGKIEIANLYGPIVEAFVSNINIAETIKLIICKHDKDDSVITFDLMNGSRWDLLKELDRKG